LLLDSKHY